MENKGLLALMNSPARIPNKGNVVAKGKRRGINEIPSMKTVKSKSNKGRKVIKKAVALFFSNL